MIEKKQQTGAIEESTDLSLCSKISKHIGGIICLIVLVVDWVAYAEIMQTFNGGSFNRLYFIRYCCASAYVFAIIPWYFLHQHGLKKIKIQQELQKKLIENHKINAPFIYNDSLIPAPYSSLPENSISDKSKSNEEIIYERDIDENNDMNINKDNNDNNHIYNNNKRCELESVEPTLQFLWSMRYGIIFVGLCVFFCGYVWYLSLDHTVVAANNTIYQSQCVFVILFSSCFLNTKITLMKMFAVFLAVGGVAMVSFGTTKENNDNTTATWYGYIECIISMLIYAMQGVGTKYFGDKYFRHNLEMADDFLLMVGIGLFTFLCLWPGLIILDITGIEEFTIPTTYQDIITIIIPVLLDALFIGSYMMGITLSGPILMSLGTLSVIPISFIVDVWLHGLQITLFAVIGSLCIFSSFLVIQIKCKH